MLGSKSYTRPGLTLGLIIFKTLLKAEAYTMAALRAVLLAALRALRAANRTPLKAEAYINMTSLCILAVFRSFPNRPRNKLYGSYLKPTPTKPRKNISIIQIRPGLMLGLIIFKGSQ